MAVVMMGGDENNPMFHDFLGMSSGDGDDNGSPAVNKGGEREMDGEISAGISSERPGTNNSEVFHFHGTKNVISEPEASNALSGRKRSSLSSYMSLIREKMLSLESDSLESSCLMKTFGKSHDEDEMPYSIQLPPRSASSLLLHPPLVGRADTLISKWDRSPVNPGIMGQSGANINKFSSSCSYKDVNVGATLIPQAAADEGSRTGMRGSGILNIINSSSSGACELKTAGSLPYTNRSKAPQIVEPESSNVPGRYNLASSTRQMTIFYAGQAHVFDDVHPNKADVIMALAGSSGVSWTTNCSLKPGVSPPVNVAIAPRKENELPNNNNFRVPARGLVSQVSQIPLTNDLQSLAPGVRQGDRAGRKAVESDRDGKKDA
ncbi:uncharacterized protein A4U43_C08F6520 [Asparagus officinalis]|uniref:protein TIFY 8 n=1 Tax=Asparagus officinalis TaxID=4686 RepID=UPI00098E324A|nr:protein TIFY 8 [Asparagus officinalis]ONK59447.1 uncharacterized protein A4U43_C08F6520 [Asparagus officinalis]